MSSKDSSLANQNLENCPSAEGFKIHIVVSDWNDDITNSLLEGARKTLTQLNISKDDLEVLHVPGTFELPVAAKMLLKNRASDAVICLGCVIKGETEHDLFINQSVANSLSQLSIISGKPIVFGVLTVNNAQQAKDRSGGTYGNKGVEAAVTAVKMANLYKDLTKPGKSIGF